MLSQGIDTVVLGCTHYPFVIPLIQQITGPDVRVIDPAPAVARQVQRLLVASHFLELDEGIEQGFFPWPQPLLQILTSGDPVLLERMLPELIGEKIPVSSLAWKSGRLVSPYSNPGRPLSPASHWSITFFPLSHHHTIITKFYSLGRRRPTLWFLKKRFQPPL
jgi:hypothetical protein